MKAIIGSQLEAAVTMLENAVRACPDAVWADRSQQPEFWYIAYHTLFWLDLYLTGSIEGFSPPPPFGLEELDPEGVIPERPYSKAELLRYLEHCRAKFRTTIETLTEEAAGRQCTFRWGTVSFAELLVYTLRHAQHHTGQLNIMLRLRTNSAPRWIARG